MTEQVPKDAMRTEPADPLAVYRVTISREYQVTAYSRTEAIEKAIVDDQHWPGARLIQVEPLS